jgi:hypothetical protein
MWMFAIVDDLWKQIAPLFHRPGLAPQCSDCFAGRAGLPSTEKENPERLRETDRERKRREREQQKQASAEMKRRYDRRG